MGAILPLLLSIAFGTAGQAGAKFLRNLLAKKFAGKAVGNIAGGKVAGAVAPFAGFMGGMAAGDPLTQRLFGDERAEPDIGDLLANLQNPMLERQQQQQEAMRLGDDTAIRDLIENQLGIPFDELLRGQNRGGLI